jgi:hypothetical protein
VRLFLDANEDGVYQPARDLPLAAPLSGGGMGSPIHFSTDFSVLPLAEATLFVVCDVGTTAETGEHFVAFFDPLTDVGAVGQHSGFPVLLSGGALHGPTITVGPAGSLWVRGETSGVSETSPPGAAGAVLLCLSLTAGTSEPILVESLHFTATGPVEDLTGLSAVFLYVDGDGDGRFDATRDRLLAGPLLPDSVNLRIDANLGVILPPGSTSIVFLVAKVENDAREGSVFSIGLARNADVRGRGTLTGHRANVLGLPVFGGEVLVATQENPPTSEGACGGGTIPAGPVSLLSWMLLGLAIALLRRLAHHTDPQ